MDRSQNGLITAKEAKEIALIKETSEVLKSVYRNLWALYEVNAAIKSGYYADERVLIKDLLTPEVSPLYKTDKFLKANAKIGIFKKTFADELKSGKYPLLISLLGTPPDIAARETASWPIIDSTNEIWTDAGGENIYFPYSENFVASNPFDVTVNTMNGQLVTIVGAVEDADSGVGSEPYYYVNPDPMGFQCMDNICYRDVTVNDDYAEIHATHIIGVGAEIARVMNPPPPPTPNQLVFIGDVLCTEQLDKLISVHDGGGPDIRFVRGKEFLTLADGSVSTVPDLVPANLTRKDVRKQRWHRIYSIWDGNWESDNKQQVFAVFEEDTKGDINMSGSVQTTLTYPASGGNPSYTAVGTKNYNYTEHSMNPVQRQLSWDRVSFFGYNHGNLNNGCGSRDGWTIYDCNQWIRYTMPQQ